VTLDRPAADAADRVRGLDGVGEVSVTGSTLTADCDPRTKAAVVDAAREDGAAVLDIRSEETSLEELFANVTEGGQTTAGDDAGTTGGESA